MAAAALVSTADEDVRLSEQAALDQLLERLESLSLHDPKDGAEIHRRYASRIASDPKAGSKAALASVARLRGKSDQALMVLYVAGAIARADGKLSDVEQQVLERLAETLDVSYEDSVAQLWQPGVVDA